MGRAYQNRKESMAKTAGQKTRIYSKYGTEIYVCAKNGGFDPDGIAYDADWDAGSEDARLRWMREGGGGVRPGLAAGLTLDLGAIARARLGGAGGPPRPARPAVGRLQSSWLLAACCGVAGPPLTFRAHALVGRFPWAPLAR